VPTVAILGPGGVGGFLAAALTRAGEPVIVVAREATAEQIKARGIEVRSERLGSFRAQPQVTGVLARPLRLLLVATKATTLESALERITVVPELTVPLLNGIEHMHLLRERFGPDRVAAGVIRVESSSPRPGRIIQTSPFLRVDLAADDPRVRPRLYPVAEMLERAGVPARLQDSEAQVLWSKLVRLVALACTTSASGRTIGYIRSDPEWRTTLEACINEAAAVADAEGARVDPQATLAELDEAHPGLGSSMQRDISAGREPELDAIAGAVRRAAKRRGIECPTLARLSEQIAERAGLAVGPSLSD
jgi:2-dehydropantoate 2-reductase